MMTVQPTMRFQEILSHPETAWLRRLREEAYKAFTEKPWPQTQKALYNPRKLEAILKSTSLAEVEVSIEQGADLVELITPTHGEETSWQKHFFGLAQESFSKWQALTAAFWQKAYVIRVPQNSEVDSVMEMTWRLKKEGLAATYLLFVLEANAKLRYSEKWLSEGNENQLLAHQVDFILEPGANLEFISISDLKANVLQFVHREACVDQDAKITYYLGEFGSQMSRTGYISHLIAPGAESRSTTVFFGKGTQQFEFYADVFHESPYTQSAMKTAGVLDDKARTSFVGRVKIEHNAAESKGEQSEKVLLLHPDARADAIPLLEIDNKDVAAAHAVSMGPLDEEQLFYFMSRGIPYETAKGMIVESFLSSLTRALPEQSQAYLLEIMGRKLAP